MAGNEDLLDQLRDPKRIGHEGLRESAAIEIDRLRRENDRLIAANRVLQMRDDYVTGCLV